MKRVIDAVVIHIVEEQLLAHISSIFSPSIVCRTTADITALVAGESAECSRTRKTLGRQLEVLKSGITTCTEFSKRAALVDDKIDEGQMS